VRNHLHRSRRLTKQPISVNLPLTDTSLIVITRLTRGRIHARDKVCGLKLTRKWVYSHIPRIKVMYL
jgi:hypothetical protein